MHTAFCGLSKHTSAAAAAAALAYDDDDDDGWCAFCRQWHSAVA